MFCIILVCVDAHSPIEQQALERRAVLPMPLKPGVKSADDGGSKSDSSAEKRIPNLEIPVS